MSLNNLSIGPESPAAFLQSALLVDDLAMLSTDYESADAALGTRVSAGDDEDDDLGVLHDIDNTGGNAAATDAPSLEHPREAVVDEGLPDRIDALAVVNGFAAHGIACATLRPHSPTGDDRERIRTLATRSDIVILDWVLGPRVTPDGDIEAIAVDPKTSRSLIGDIVADDIARGGRLRLLCVYTGDADLDGIRQQLVDELADRGVDADQTGDNWEITAPNLRIVIAPKPRNPVHAQEAIREPDLPGRLVAVFSAFADGLLRHAALVGIAAVRNNAHRLLLRFPPQLDPAFLSHHALVGPSDARDYAVWLIGEELSATAMAAAVETGVPAASVRAAIDKYLPARVSGRKMLTEPTKRGLTVVETDIARRLFQEGRDPGGIGNGHCKPANIKGAASVTALLIEGSEETVLASSEASDDSFAVLSCLSRDPRLEGSEQSAPILSLGSILYRTNDSSYFLCMQPLCDSVRLRQETAFPLLPLVKASGGMAWDITVPDPTRADKLQRLSSLGGKLNKLEMVPFAPGASFMVHASMASISGLWSRWHFTAIDSVQYAWVGDLRRDQASRCALLLSQTAARVGVSESEYQRVRASRS